MESSFHKSGDEKNINAAIAKIADFLKETSGTLASDILNTDSPMEYKETPVSEIVHGDRMSLVFVAGPAVRVIFKVHYDSSLAGVLKMAPEVSDHKISKQFTSQIMQEYANLVAGRCKSMLDERDVETGLSLPLSTGGIDEVFFRNLKISPYLKNVSWVLQPSGLPIKMTISISVEILIPEVVPQILQDIEHETKSGELDLF